jgi:hypothetical protein
LADPPKTLLEQESIFYRTPVNRVKRVIVLPKRHSTWGFGFGLVVLLAFGQLVIQDSD